jgi:hypothetical protein
MSDYSGRTTIDYYSLIARAVSKLPSNTAEERQALYEQARATLANQLRLHDPPLSGSEIASERFALEAAFLRVEEDTPSMNDPHVETLHYSIRHADTVDFNKAPPLEYDKEPSFSVHIENGQANIKMKDHHPTEESARAAVEPFLEAWELKCTLDDADDKFEFVFQRADIVDRMQTHGQIYAQGFADGDSTASAHAHTQRLKYPDPPVGLAFDSNVELMLYCYRMYREGRSRLGDTAYFCFTVLRQAAGNRKQAARLFGIELSILAKLGELSSVKGGREARKAEGAQVDFTDTERAWLEAVMKTIIRRTSEVAFDPQANQKQITMGDLPPLA